MQSASTDTLNEGTKVTWNQLKSHNFQLITNNIEKFIGSLYKHNRPIAITQETDWMGVQSEQAISHQRSTINEPLTAAITAPHTL